MSATPHEDDLLGWWECDNCGASGRDDVAGCPSCGSMEIGRATGGVELPPCWKHEPAIASMHGVERTIVHLDGPAFISIDDGEAELIRAEIKAGEKPDPEGVPATAENVRELAETYNDEFYGENNQNIGGQADA